MTLINFSKRKLKTSNPKIKIIERSETPKLTFLLICITTALKSKFTKYNLFLPHPDHLLGNTLFFNNNANKITIIEDGILNYYDYKRSSSVEKNSIKRSIITWPTPFRYRLYKGHHSGTDACPTVELYGWFSSPDKIVQKHKFKSLNQIAFPLYDRTKENKYAKVLLLDQPLEKFLKPETAEKIRNKTKKIIEARFESVIVKPHPEHNSHPGQFTNQSPSFFEKNTPIEESIFDIKPDIVISYCSTALINISKIAPHIKCISIGMRNITEEVPSLLTIEELFTDNGIEII